MRILVKDLKAGDIMEGDHIVIATQITDRAELGVKTAKLNEYPGPPIQYHTWRTGEQVEVVRQELTPAQQHADAMLALLKRLRGYDNSSVRDIARDMVERVEPPQPPTLEEWVNIVRALVTTAVAIGAVDPSIYAAQALLKRVPQ